MIGILDYGVGNVGAYLRIFHSHNIPVKPIRSADDFKEAEKIILPGVGAFDSAMQQLNESGLREQLDSFVLERHKPLLAVCIGMHMLGRSSEEGELPGLGYIAGVTRRLSVRPKEKTMILPHMGWNDVEIDSKEFIWKGIRVKEGFYFLHSYAFVPDQTESTIGSSVYGYRFSVGVRSGNVYGFQFHPEKSLLNGVTLLKNFAENV